MNLRSLIQDILSEVSSKIISFQIELHLLIIWVRNSVIEVRGIIGGGGGLSE